MQAKYPVKNTNEVCPVRTKPKVSVTVITYNHGEWLAECLESIVTQKTDFPFEVIVGDDASTDEITPRILRDYAERYPHLLVPVFRDFNINPTQNYLDVLRRTTGKYIAHIDGDDIMLPGKLQKQVDFLDSHPECSIVAHDVRIVDGRDGTIISNSFHISKVPHVADINYLVRHGCYFAHCSKMYRRTAVKSWERDRRTIDFFYHIEQAAEGKIGYLNEILGIYRKSCGTVSDPLAPCAEVIRKAVSDAFNQARELGVNKEVVRRGELRNRRGSALHILRLGRPDTFRRWIELRPQDMPYATWTHKVAYYLRGWPGLVHLLMTITKAMMALYRRSRRSKRSDSSTFNSKSRERQNPHSPTMQTTHR